MHDHDSNDLKRLGEFKLLAPTELSAFVNFDKTVDVWIFGKPEVTSALSGDG